MRIIHTGDLHLGVSFKSVRGLNIPEYINKNIVENFRYACEYAVRNKADLFLIAGDIFNNIYSSIPYSPLLARSMRILKDNNIPIVIIGGNHDIPKTRGYRIPLSIIHELGVSNVYYIDRYVNEPIYIRHESNLIAVAPIPFMHYSIERNAVTEIKRYVDSLKFRIEKQSNVDYKILIAHQDVEGAIYSERDMYARSYYDIYKIPPTILHPEFFNYIALGHIHLPQIIPGFNNMVYSGSLERVSFGEWRDQKSFVDVELNGSNIKIKRVNVNATKMIKLNVRVYSDPTNDIRSALSTIDVRKSLVRIILETEYSKWIELKSKLNKLDDIILEELNALGYRIDPEIKIPEPRDFNILPSATESDWLLKAINEYINNLRGVGEKDKEGMKKLLSKMFDEVGRL